MVMKIKHTKVLKDGRQHMLIELQPGEHLSLLHVAPNSFFRLGYPLEDQIIESHHLTEFKRVAWDAYSQKWVDV
jgi:hypothetical protein